MKKRSTKTPFIIYPDLEPLHEKISTCHNNPKKSSTSKINEHRPSRCSLFTQCLFDATKNNIDFYRDKDCMKMFCKYLKQHAAKVIKYEKTEMIPIANEKKIYIVGKTNMIYSKQNLALMMIIKIIITSKIISTMQENIEELLMIFVI